MTDRRKFLTAGGLALATGALGASEALAQAGPAKRSFAGAKSFAATEKGKPWTALQRKTGPISIDMHNHWAPEVYLKAKADLGQPDFLDPSNADMARRVKLQEALGIQTSVLTLGGFRPWVWVTPAQGAKIAAGVNDAAIAAHKAYPKSFVAGIELNVSDPAGSLAELNRVAGQPGMVCIHLPTMLAGQEFMFAPAFQPIFARAEELGLPIFLHPLDGMANWSYGKRLVDEASGVAPGADLTGGANRFPGLTNSLGNSLELSITISKLISSGLLDKYPTLTFISIQGGGGMPYMAGRLEARGRLKKPMGEYLRRFYYDSLVYYPESLRYLAAMVGSDRIVLGSDNMYATAENQMSNQPHAVIDGADFNDEDRDLILRGNLKRLFKI